MRDDHKTDKDDFRARRQLLPDIISAGVAKGANQGEANCSVLAADVVGFTSLTERLRVEGERGRERLGQILSGAHRTIGRVVAELGGSVVATSGDGFLVLFPDDAGLRAASAAVDIRNALASGIAGQPLELRVGLARGDIGWTLYRAGTRAAYGLEGTPIVRASLAERAADAGAILADAGLAADLPGVFGPPNDDGFAFLREPVSKPVATPSPPPPPAPKDLTDALLPLETSAFDASGEFREVISAFIRIPDAAEQDDRRRIVETILELSAARGGFGWRLDQGASGVTFFMFWGAPAAHEHDVDRAIGTLRALLMHAPAELAIGASLGLIYAGFVGTERFQDYACLGASTNLAARLAQNATPGSFWIDDRLARRIDGRAPLRHAGARHLKGFEGEIAVHSVEGDLAPKTWVGRTALVGREELRARLVGTFERLAKGDPVGGVILEGEPGIGKSHLANTVVRSLPDDILCLRAETSPVLRPSLGPAWQILGQAVPNRDALETIIANARASGLGAALVRSAPFLAEGLGIDWPAKPDPTIDGETRSRLTQNGIAAALRAVAENRPLLLHIEDIHWLDDDSRAVVSTLLRRTGTPGTAPAIGILMTARPRDRHLPSDTGAEIHRIERLDPGAIGDLTAALLDGPPSKRLLALVEERSAGVALFVSQLVRFLQDTDLLEKVGGVWHLVDRFEAQRLPADARALLTSRIDRLPDEARKAVAITAVLGGTVTTDLLAALAIADKKPFAAPQDALVEATTAGVLLRDGEGYGFSHALLRDAAYEMLLPSRRGHLHRLAARILGNRGSGPAILALHFDRGELPEQAIRHHLAAAEEASAAYQNEAAIWHYGRALDLSPEDGTRARFDIAVALDRLFLRISDHARQEPMLDLLDDLAAHLEPLDRLVAALARADYLAERSRHPEAIPLLEPLRPIADRHPGSELCIRFYRTLSFAYNYTDVAGRIETGTRHARTAVKHAERNGASEQIALALTHEAAFYRYRDDPKAERVYREALRRTSDPVLTSRILHRLGSIAFRGGARDEGYGLYEEAMLLAEKTGDLDRKGALALGLAFQAEREGNIAMAICNYQEVMAAGRELNQPQLIMEALRSLANLAGTGGRIREADEMYLEVATGRSMDAAIAAALRATHCLLRSEWTEAEALLARYEAWAIEMDYRAELASVWAMRATAFVIQGRYSEAREILPILDAAIEDFSEAESYGQNVDRANGRRVKEVCRAVLEGHVELGQGAPERAHPLAEAALATLTVFDNATNVIDVSISGIGPASEDLALTHDLLARLDHPAADRVLIDAQRRLNDLADRFEAAGYARDAIWCENPFRAYLMGRAPGQPGLTLVQAFADHRSAPASTRA